MKQKSSLNYLLSGAIALTSALGCDAKTPSTASAPAPSNQIPVTLVEGGKQVQRNIPIYNDLNERGGMCSRYVMQAGAKLYHEEFSRSNAWDRRYNDKVVAQVGNKTLDELADSEVLKPGMVAGVYNPKSNHRYDKDQTGKTVAYTHVVLYLGQNPKGEPVFAHQFGKKTLVETEKQLQGHGLVPKEIIAPKNYKK